MQLYECMSLIGTCTKEHLYLLAVSYSMHKENGGWVYGIILFLTKSDHLLACMCSVVIYNYSDHRTVTSHFHLMQVKPSGIPWRVERHSLLLLR